MIYYIYKITNILNGKIYVGQRTSKKDISEDKYMGSGVFYKRAVDKYGKENFKKSLLEYCNKDNIDEREIYWIAKLNSTDLNIGYNLCAGGGTTLGLKMTEEQKQKVSKSLIGNKRTLGFKPTKETMSRMSKSHTGKKHSQETKEKCRNCFKGRKHTEENKEKQRAKMMGNDYFKGHHLSDEVKKNISERMKDRASKGIINFKGKKHSKETLELMSLIHKNRDKITCPHCNLILDVSNAKRWHFDNCKYKSPQI